MMVRRVPKFSRRFFAALTSLLLVLFWVPGLIDTPALAATAAPHVVGGFEIDGDFAQNTMPAPGGDDWNNVATDATSDPTATADTTNFSGGSKECTSGGDCSSDNWVRATGTAPNKADISNVYVASRLLPNAADPTQTDVWGYFGFTRVDNSGSVFYDIELNQAANHTLINKANPTPGISVPTRSDGDVLIVLDQNGNGDFAFNGTIQKWVDAKDAASCETGLVKPCWGVPSPLPNAISDFYGRSNDITVPGYQGSGSYAPDLFGEVAINLTAVHAIAGCPSKGFVAMNIRSKASPGQPSAGDGDVTGSAEIKDYVSADVSIPSTCGELKIVKYGPDGATLPGGGAAPKVAGATYTIDPNPTPNSSGILTIRDADSGPNADGKADGVIDIDPAVPGTYTVTETVPPPGYFLPSVADRTDSNVVVTEYGSGTNATVKEFDDPLGSITINKTGNGAALTGATFTLSRPADAVNNLPAYSKTIFDAATGTNADGHADGTFAWDHLLQGTYTLHEEAPVPTGYDAASDRTFVITDASSDATHGKDLTATVNDPKKTTSIRLHKTQRGSNGTVAVAGATFDLWQETNNQAGLQMSGAGTHDTKVAGYSCTTDSNGYCASYGPVTWTNTYYWVETSAPAPYTVPTSNVWSQDVTTNNVTTNPLTAEADDPVTPVLTTTASSTNTVDGTIGDSADLTGFGGSVTGEKLHFSVYTNSSCTGTPYWPTTASDGDVAMNAAGHAAVSGVHVDSTAAPNGLYYWKVVYDGDTNNNATSESCGTAANNEISKAPVLGTPVKYNNPGTIGPNQTATPTTVSIFKNNNQITYLITVTNVGAAEMDGVTVTDPVSSFATYNLGSIGCGGDALNCATDTTDPTSLTWSFDLGPKVGTTVKTANLTFSVTVNASDSFNAVIDNTASVANGKTSTSTNTVSNPVNYPVLSINKCASPAPQSIPVGTNSGCTTNASGFVAPDSTITYSLTVQNSGDQDASGVSVTDVIPARVKYLSAACDTNDATCSVQPGSSAGTTVTWSGVFVPKKVATTPGSVVLTLTVQVLDNTHVTNGQKIDNTASFAWSNSGSTPPDESGTSATVEHVVKFPIITGTKDANPLPIGDPIPGTNPQQFANGIVHPGDVITYTLGAQNAGLAAKTITITDDVPGGTTYNAGSASCGTAQSCTVSTSTSNNVTTITWQLTLPPGTQGATAVVPATAQVTFSVTVTDGHANGDIISNFATVDGVTTRTVTHEVTYPIITATKSSVPVSGTSSSPTLVGPNTKITYTVSVSNAGLQDKTVTVSDQVPTGTTYDNDASCGSAPSCTVSASTNGSGVTTVTWTLTAPAGTGTAPNITPTVEHLTFSVTTPEVQSKLIDNTATFTNDHTPNCTDPTCSTDTTHHEVVFPVITADKAADPAGGGSAANATAVSPGQVITYTLNVHNTGEANASAVAVTDAIPAGTSYVAGSADNGGSYDATSNKLSWTVDIAQHTSLALTFKVTVLAGDANGTIIPNTASYSQVHNPTPSDCANGTCSTNTTYHEVKFPVLALSKSADPASGSIVQRGDTINYTLTVVNSGLAAGPAVVSDTLPDNVTLVGGSASPAPTSVNGKTLTWNVTVPAGGTTLVTYKVTVDQDAPEGSTQTNVALIGGQCVGNADPSACTTQHHVPTGALTLVKAVDKTTANYGDTLTYAFTAATTGAINQTAVTVTDVLPKGTSFVAGSARCTDAGPCTTSYDATTKTVTWQLGDMAAGASRHLTFKVTIDQPNFDVQAGLPPLTIDNVGAIVSGETASRPSNHVITKVVAVLGVKVVRKPRKLPFTGMPTQEATAIAMLMIGAGVVLTRVRRRREQ